MGELSFELRLALQHAVYGITGAAGEIQRKMNGISIQIAQF
jgi:hypothetical protein